jgi:hypothetical protein
VIEAQRVAALVFDALKADPTLSQMLGARIYRDQVPAAAALPAATVAVVDSTDTVTLGGDRVFDTVVIDVRVMANGASYGPINPAADRVDALVQGLAGTNGGVSVAKLRRDQPRLFIENEAGIQTSHILQTYRSEAFAL